MYFVLLSEEINIDTQASYIYSHQSISHDEVYSLFIHQWYRIGICIGIGRYADDILVLRLKKLDRTSQSMVNIHSVKLFVVYCVFILPIAVPSAMHVAVCYEQYTDVCIR